MLGTIAYTVIEHTRTNDNDDDRISSFTTLVIKGRNVSMGREGPKVTPSSARMLKLWSTRCLKSSTLIFRTTMPAPPS